MNFTVEQARPTLELIGKYESRNSYTIVYGGIPAERRPKDLTKMTINQVIEWQRNVVNAGAKSSAAGYYQIIRKTLEGSFEAAGLLPGNLFDEGNQDILGMYLLDMRGFQDYLDGKITEDAMMIGLAKEWASFPVPYDMKGATRNIEEGQSYYAGDGLNAAHASTDEVRAALRESKFLYDGTKPKSKRPLLVLGDKGTNVVDLQDLLAAHGLFPWEVDGDFGEKTDASVRYFQATRALGIDGKVGNETWNALEV